MIMPRTKVKKMRMSGPDILFLLLSGSDNAK